MYRISQKQLQGALIKCTENNLLFDEFVNGKKSCTWALFRATSNCSSASSSGLIRWSTTVTDWSTKHERNCILQYCYNIWNYSLKHNCNRFKYKAWKKLYFTTLLSWTSILVITIQGKSLLIDHPKKPRMPLQTEHYNLSHKRTFSIKYTPINWLIDTPLTLFP